LTQGFGEEFPSFATASGYTGTVDMGNTRQIDAHSLCRRRLQDSEKTVAVSGGGVDIDSTGQVRQSAIVTRNDVDLRFADAVEVIAHEWTSLSPACPTLFARRHFCQQQNEVQLGNQPSRHPFAWTTFIRKEESFQPDGRCMTSRGAVTTYGQ
jgi:hypothetical protein